MTCTIAQRKLCYNDDCETCFNRSFASHEKAQFWSNKNTLKPRQVFLSAGKKYWFNCTCGHEFESSPNAITCQNPKWCPYCGNHKLCNNDDCETCFNRSFASHEKAQFWSDKNTLKSRQVTNYTCKKYWFNCTCGHEFERSPADINRTVKPQWCPYCGNQKLCDNDCDSCFNRSFASHDKAQFWSNKNTLKPRQVFKRAGKKYWFNCKCGHEFESRLANIARPDVPSWCAYCCGQAMCVKDDCTMCLNRSFATHEKAQFWSDKNKLTPRQVFKSANTKYWFKCEQGHEFESTVNNVTNINNPKWCALCVNKTEKKLMQHLKLIYNSVQHQFTPDWCKNPKTKRCLPFDFVIDELNIIIELDGEQHFTQISNWQCPLKTQKRDMYKMKCANENGYTVIRILQEDVLYDRINWMDELSAVLTKYDTPSRVFIGSEEKYQCHIE